MADWRTRGLTALLPIGGLVVGLALGELALRVLHPPPRTQVFRSSAENPFEPGEGDALIIHPSHDRTNTACVADRPDAVRIAAYGDSITYGSGADDGAEWPAQLQRELDTIGGGRRFCVINHGVPGYNFASKRATLRASIDEERPDLVLWEDWAPEAFDVVVVGDNAYYTQGLALDADGVPSAFHVPPRINRALLAHSRLYEYATLALATARSPVREDAQYAAFARDELPSIVDEVEARHARLVMILGTTMTGPFDAFHEENRFHAPVQQLARDRKVPVVAIDQLLVDQDVVAMRADTCCHLSNAGNAAFAAALAPLVLQALAGPPPGEWTGFEPVKTPDR
jgi:hypothetical protein